MNNNFLSKEDYEEPRCPCEKPNAKKPIPVMRVIDKLDEYLSRRDYGSAEQHLIYWLNEARAENDIYGELTVLNEQIGLYRKVSNKALAYKAIDTANVLIESGAFDDLITKATAFINIATAYNAFDEPEKALPLYDEACKIYESSLKSDDARLGGLYNNTALTVMKLGDYDRANELFFKALDIMSKINGAEPQMAVTYCNLADLEVSKSGLIKSEEKIGEHLEKAMSLLDTEGAIRDGEYAFVCEKCAPVFGYYGFFRYKSELEKRASEIYERT